MSLNYKQLNIITGWIVFVLSAMVYILTCEPSVSFWDCGEFISCAAKLQVSHSPGAPLFIMISHLFMMLHPSVANKGVMVNYYCAIQGGFVIMFLFWIITHFARKIIAKGKEELIGINMYAVIGAGLIGAGAGTFLDSFWFSTVEGIVWSSSAFYTAIVIWSILKWENIADEPYADRWLILIGYVMGLSIGVHLLNLLTIPMVVFTYYFRKGTINTKNTFIAIGVAIGILFMVQYGIIQYLVLFASQFELLFVNQLGLPFNTGFLFFVLLVISGIIYGLYYAHQHSKYWLHLGLVTSLMIIIGYSSYTMVVLRSSADVSINMGDPSDPFSLKEYLARSQYGSAPFLYGQVFTAKVVKVEDGAPQYHKNLKTNKYDIVAHKPEITYDDDDQMFFPRVWDTDAHVGFYRQWLGLNADEKPSFVDNIKFFLGYQVYYMYWRYFLWDFSGRQNDIQGERNSDVKGGNWITGFDFIDAARLGSQSHLPDVLKNKARNSFYMLPLILGLIGMFFQYRNSRNDWWLILMLFFMMGIAILLYLNQTPQQPRERDYSYACSFIVFCVWIGLGTLSVFKWLQTRMSGSAAVGLSIAICAVVPVLMGTQGWDDHDRSHRLTAHDLGVDYLESCKPNAILFTQGDNDTYPLWYCQEVEGIRPDVRIVNLSLVGVDWYIDNLRRKQNTSDPVEMTLTSEQEVGDNRNYVPSDPRSSDPNRYYDALEIMKGIASDEPSKQVELSNGKKTNYIPTYKLSLKVDANYWHTGGIINDTAALPEAITWELPSRKRNLQKNDLVMLDIIANNFNKRPIYLPLGGSPENFLGLQDFMQQEGLTTRLTPLKKGKPDQFGYPGFVNSTIMYDNVMNKFKWGNVDKYNLYMDENISRMMSNLRTTFVRLSAQLLDEGKNDKALEVMDRCFTALPTKNIPLDIYDVQLVENYYRAGNKEKAESLAKDLFTLYSQELDYFNGLSSSRLNSYNNDAQRALYIINSMANYTKKYGNADMAKKYEDKLNSYGSMSQKLGKPDTGDDE